MSAGGNEVVIEHTTLLVMNTMFQELFHGVDRFLETRTSYSRRVNCCVAHVHPHRKKNPAVGYILKVKIELTKRRNLFAWSKWFELTSYHL